MTVQQIVTIPVGAQGVDFSGWRPGDEIAAWSYVVRYVWTGPASQWKAVTRPEVDFYHSLGVAVALVLEVSADSWTGGAPVGADHGARAVDAANTLGYPPVAPILYAFDTNVLPGDDRARSYGEAAADRCLPAGFGFGPYADLDVIRMLAARSTCNWLAGATSWSAPNVGGHYRPELEPDYDLVHVRQVIDGSTPSYDRNITLRPFPAWLPHDVETITTPAQGDHPVSAFTHSDNDHEGHPARWSYWVLMPDGTKRHIGEVELGILGTRDTAPAMTMDQIDQLPDWVAPAAVTVTDPGSHGTWTT